MVRSECQLYSVDGVFNAILVTGNAVGDVMFYGSGAGKLPTASAVAGDIVELAKCAGSHIDIVWSQERFRLTPMDSMESRFFVRVKNDEADEAKKLFGVTEDAGSLVSGECAFITEKMSEADFAAKAEKLQLVGRIRFNG